MLTRRNNERKGPRLLSCLHRQLIARLLGSVYLAFKRRQRRIAIRADLSIGAAGRRYAVQRRLASADGAPPSGHKWIWEEVK